MTKFSVLLVFAFIVPLLHRFTNLEIQHDNQASAQQSAAQLLAMLPIGSLHNILRHVYYNLPIFAIFLLYLNIILREHIDCRPFFSSPASTWASTLWNAPSPTAVPICFQTSPIADTCAWAPSPSAVSVTALSLLWPPYYTCAWALSEILAQAPNDKDSQPNDTSERH